MKDRYPSDHSPLSLSQKYCHAISQKYSNLSGHVCLVNSFYGLDLPSTVPAHVVLTGPTARSGNDRRRETSDETLGIEKEGMETMAIVIEEKPRKYDTIQ